jgi:hypothetical protein
MLRALGAVCVVAVGCGAILAQAPTAEPQPQNVLKIKTKSNIKNDRTAAPRTGVPGAVRPAPEPVDAAKIKSHSNQSNNRAAEPGAATGAAATGTTADKPKTPVPTKHVSNIKWSARTAAGTPGTGSDPQPAAAAPSANSQPATKPR